MDQIIIGYTVGKYTGEILITCDHDFTNEQVIKNAKLQLDEQMRGLPFGIHEFNIIDRHPMHE